MTGSREPNSHVIASPKRNPARMHDSSTAMISYLPKLQSKGRYRHLITR